ncbi:b3 domain-containing transcription factor vrn1 [Quercus suber]|uniref:B3 domain-containing transcription factor vrn1 n=1 Tax=Quercus suber TaxID=58331 RepID=A0AAW0L4P8_QUESU
MANAPHFFKIVLNNCLRDGKLTHSSQGIPRKFTRKYGQELSNFAFLKLPSGAEWNVELTESDGEVWLQKGWPEFAKYYSVKEGHFLVFRYEGNSHFCVLIFDESATEIDYHFNTSHRGKGKLHNELIAPNMEEIESYSAIEFLGSFPPSPKTRDKSPLPYFQPHKIMKTNSSAKGVKGISTTKQCLKSKAVRMIQPLNNNEIARALQRASAFKPKNPYFKVVIQQSYLDRNLNIPKDFVKKYSNILHGDVNLWVSDGSNWPVEFCKRTDENLKCRFNCRWKAFAKDNNLEVGDVCAFELIEATKTFKVVIFRVNEENCRALYC